VRSLDENMVLAVEGITKRFPGVIALDNVNMELYAGKVTAVIGENGAGKSTLMKVLSGIYQDYEGRLILNNEEIQFKNPGQARNAGVVIIHQELNLIPYLSVRENIFLGREITTGYGFIDKKEMRNRTREILSRLKQKIAPETLISELKVGQQQIIEIAKALMFDAKVIIMDEPTSAISDSEIDTLFEIIRELKKEGKAIAYISHKLDELSKISDNYVVLRDGKLIGAGEMKGLSHDEIIQKMVGREIQLMRKTEDFVSKGDCLEISNISLSNPEMTYENLVSDVSLSLSKGEILGIFGLMGAGRTELLETIFGLHSDRSSGEIIIDSKRCHFKSSSDAINEGIGLVPEDRANDGLILEMDVKTNISLSNLEEIESSGFLSIKKEKELSQKYIEKLGIKTFSAEQKTRNLSGGNQQKIVLAKWLATNPKILLLDEPTRGIDINARNEIYKLISKLASEGLGIIMVSSELVEILAVSDRILVMSDGRVTGEFMAHQATEENLMEAAIP